MRHLLACSVLVIALTSLTSCSDSDPGSAPKAEDSPPSTSTSAEPEAGGRILFKRLDAAVGGTVIYTANSDGTQVELLFGEESEGPRWSPDGTEFSVFCCGDGMAAHIIDVETGELRTLPQPDPELETNCAGSWSPDGKRLSCGGYGTSDPRRNGLYSIRSSDGGGLRRMTSAPSGYDIAGDYSPDGRRLVFVRSTRQERPVGLFVTNVDGTGVRRLTPKGLIVDNSGFAGSWSPEGDRVLFVARTSEDNHKAIWVVDADGGTPEQLSNTPACGGLLSAAGQFGCYSPDWSPDGTKILFARFDGAGESIYTMNADGSGLTQVTDGEDDQPDWAPAPVS